MVLTENLFGDILSDESAVITGSLGMLPSATIGGKVNLYEPVHGSAPDIAGKGLANPLGAILTGALILRHSGGLEAEAAAIESAVRKVLEQGFRTPDLARGESAGLAGAFDERDGREGAGDGEEQLLASALSFSCKHAMNPSAIGDSHRSPKHD